MLIVISLPCHPQYISLGRFSCQTEHKTTTNNNLYSTFVVVSCLVCTGREKRQKGMGNRETRFRASIRTSVYFFSLCCLLIDSKEAKVGRMPFIFSFFFFRFLVFYLNWVMDRLVDWLARSQNQALLFLPFSMNLRKGMTSLEWTAVGVWLVVW